MEFAFVMIYLAVDVWSIKERHCSNIVNLLKRIDFIDLEDG
jgi:hypothetical protein